MSLANKLLIGFFIILLLIILGEVGYFYIFSQKENVIKTVTQKVNNVSPSQNPPVETPGALTKIDAIFNNAKAYIEELGPSIKNKALKSLLITTSFETTIIIAAKKNITVDLPASSLPQQVSAILVIDDNNYGQLEYPFSEAELVKLNILAVDEQGVENPIEFDDLEPGDKISLILTLDLLKHPNDNLVSGEIKKYPALSSKSPQ